MLNLFAFGAIFKVMHWPGAGILITVGLGLFALIFLPLAFFNNYRGEGKKQFSLHLSGFICALICISGALFKVQHWPGSGIMLIIGVPLPFLYFLPVYLYHHNKAKEKSVINFLGVMFLMLYISVFSAFLSLSVGKEILNSMVTMYEDFSKTNELYTLKNNMDYLKLESSLPLEKKQKVEKIKTKTIELEKTIESIKIDLIKGTDGINSPAIKGNKIEIGKFSAREESSFTTNFMHGADGASGMAVELKTKIVDYREFLLSILKDNQAKYQNINKLLNTSDITDSNIGEAQKIPWEVQFFQNGTYAIVILTNLECLETRIKMSEAELLSSFK